MSEFKHGLPETLAHDWRQLQALIADTAERDRVPCRAADSVPLSFWTSDDHHEQRLAAEACKPCPILTQCKAYGLAHRKEAGVYGGLAQIERGGGR